MVGGESPLDPVSKVSHSLTHYGSPKACRLKRHEGSKKKEPKSQRSQARSFFQHSGQSPGMICCPVGRGSWESSWALNVLGVRDRADGCSGALRSTYFSPELAGLMLSYALEWAPRSKRDNLLEASGFEEKEPAVLLCCDPLRCLQGLQAPGAPASWRGRGLWL